MKQRDEYCKILAAGWMERWITQNGPLEVSLDQIEVMLDRSTPSHWNKYKDILFVYSVLAYVKMAGRVPKWQSECQNGTP